MAWLNFPPVHAAGGSAHQSSEIQVKVGGWGAAIFATITKGGKNSQEGFTPTIKFSDPEALLLMCHHKSHDFSQSHGFLEMESLHVRTSINGGFIHLWGIYLSP